MEIFPNVAHDAPGVSSSKEGEEESAVSSSTTMMQLVNEVHRLNKAIEYQSTQLGDIVENMRSVASSLEGDNLVRRI